MKDANQIAERAAEKIRNGTNMRRDGRAEAIILAAIEAATAGRIQAVIDCMSLYNDLDDKYQASRAATDDTKPLDWQPATVAATWPEGIPVLHWWPDRTIRHASVEFHAYHRPDLVADVQKGADYSKQRVLFARLDDAMKEGK